MSAAPPLLSVDGVVRDYVLPRRRLLTPPPRVRAVDDVSFSVAAGASFGIVGESGCGKSTLARIVAALQTPSAGSVRFADHDLFAQPAERLRRLRRHFQMVFQDPYGSLDPRHKVGRTVAEPLSGLADRVGTAERRDRVAAALAEVGLDATDGDRFPHEFSGGQRQRIAIARALITRPRLIVADEPVSALDVSVQAQVLNLMMDLQEEHGLAYVFISHDLAVVRHVTDDVAVMYLGRIVEQGPTDAVFEAPAHPYTRALIDAAPEPVPGRRSRIVAGEAPPAPLLDDDPAGAPAGCAFAPRCPLADDRCGRETPPLRAVAGDRRAACHLA
jgi:peptide/nickel transport system ATP-binding protein